MGRHFGHHLCGDAVFIQPFVGGGIRSIWPQTGFDDRAECDGHLLFDHGSGTNHVAVDPWPHFGRYVGGHPCDRIGLYGRYI